MTDQPAPGYGEPAMNPTALAERATLGTLLVDPAQIVAVQGFLRPADFLHVWHRNIYAAMLTRQIAKDPITPTDIHADLIAAGHPEENRRAVRLVELMEVPPARPKAARYAAMVLEASLRRQVRDLGLLLQAGAVLAAAEHSGRDVAHAGPFREIEAQLRDAHQRWNAAAAGGAVDTPITPDVKQLDIAAAHRTNVALRAARLVDAATPPRAGQVLRAELNVLAAVLAVPSKLAAVRMRITGSLFTEATHLATYAAICDLAELGEPIDAITVCWQAQREQTLRGKGLDADALLQLTIDPPAGDPGYHAGVMADLATRTIADRCAQQLAVAAQHPGITVADLLDTAGHHVAAVRRAIAGPHPPRPGSWSRPRHLQLVARTPSQRQQFRGRVTVSRPSSGHHRDNADLGLLALGGAFGVAALAWAGGATAISPERWSPAWFDQRRRRSVRPPERSRARVAAGHTRAAAVAVLAGRRPRGRRRGHTSR